MSTKLQRLMLRIINVWPPFLGAGIRARWSDDHRSVDVEMKLRFWNRNYVGTHYGGSLYSMADPFYMLILMEALGPDYIVWDKAASIRFRKPGKGRVRAQFRVSEEQLEDVRTKLLTLEKYEPTTRVREPRLPSHAEIARELTARARPPVEEIPRGSVHLVAS